MTTYIWSRKVLDAGSARLPTDRVLFHAHATHSVTEVSLLPGHVSGTASQQTYATRTSPTRASGVNLKRTGFLAAGAQCDILLNCAIQIPLLNWTELLSLGRKSRISFWWWGYSTSVNWARHSRRCWLARRQFCVSYVIPTSWRLLANRRPTPGSVKSSSSPWSVYQDGHSSGKPGKVRELKSGQGKVRENRKKIRKKSRKMNYYNYLVAAIIVQTIIGDYNNSTIDQSQFIFWLYFSGQSVPHIQ